MATPTKRCVFIFPQRLFFCLTFKGEDVLYDAFGDDELVEYDHEENDEQDEEEKEEAEEVVIEDYESNQQGGDEENKEPNAVLIPTSISCQWRQDETYVRLMEMGRLEKLLKNIPVTYDEKGMGALLYKLVPVTQI